MKDIAGPSTASVGAGLTLTPSLLLQIIGCVVAIFGLYCTCLRYNESKRANDIAQSRLDWEKEKHASYEKKKSEEETKKTIQ